MSAPHAILKFAFQANNKASFVRFAWHVAYWFGRYNQTNKDLWPHLQKPV